MASLLLSSALPYQASSSSSTFGGSTYGGSFGGGSGSSIGLGGYAGSDKQAMQNLNDRLAAYLERVRALEESNSKLELKIREFYEKREAEEAGANDFSKYYAIISGLRGQIFDASSANSRVILQIDNARLAADDFRMKFENELALRHNVESDIIGLRKALDDLTISRGDLEIQFESLSEELAFLKRSHAEDMNMVRSSASGEVSVEMDAAPGVDLAKILNDMRENYEALAAKNREDAEAWFAEKSKDLNQQISTGVSQVQSSKSEISDLRRSLQALEIELQSQLALKKSLDDNLSDTEARYGGQLQKLQLVIGGIEEQLVQIRQDMERQNLDYRQLLNIKCKLEMEIETYRRLLDGDEGEPIPPPVVEVKKEPTMTRRVKTLVEEMVDGKVTSSYVKEVEEEVN